MNENEELRKELLSVSPVQFNTGEIFNIHEADGKAVVEKGKINEANIEITCEDTLLQSVLEGKTNPIHAFMTGKLKVGGDIMAAQALVSAIEKAR
ncbi:MAG: SCP2 sterol-binding domain-containing protein [Methanomassiliicoccales archaeon]